MKTRLLTTLALACLAVGLAASAPAKPRKERASNPFAGQRLWVNPDSSAARDAAAMRRSAEPRLAMLVDRIARRPQAIWLTGGVRKATVASLVTRIRADGALPVFVAYAVPARDCGSHSAGGAGSAQAYLRFARALAGGVGSRPAVVILEPDAVAGLDCLDAAGRRARLGLLRRSVVALEARPRLAVYIDAGHSRWQPVDEMGRRLRHAGIARAHGFALNVSNFNRTGDELAFGRRLSRATGGKHFVIDTSRNGRGPAPAGEWCNPAGRGLGASPRTNGLPSRLVDALLWVKAPGESDGTCNGGPRAGDWWRGYALGLARRASR